MLAPSFKIQQKTTHKLHQRLDAARAHKIKVCRECVHYNEIDDTCQNFAIVNHTHMEVSKIKSIQCRTNEYLCGMDAKYHKPKHTKENKSNDEIVDNNAYKITYYIDGSVSVCIEECNIEHYYDNLHQDFNDVY